MSEILNIAGDPITDVFRIGTRRDSGRFDTVLTHVRSGGAANTYLNADHIARELVETRRTWSFRSESLARFIEQDNLVLEAWNIWDHRTPAMYSHEAAWSQLKHQEPNQSIIISDYNKGTVNCNASPYGWKPENFPFRFALVDSRYRSFNLDNIKSAKCSIWHATGMEYDHEWAQNFDWVILTDGPHDIYLFNPAMPVAITVPVPALDTDDNQVLDDCGAGDTFVAAVGVWLSYHNHLPIDRSSLRQAAEFGIACAQTAVTQRYTATSTLTLEEYCTSQTPTKSSPSYDLSSKTT